MLYNIHTFSLSENKVLRVLPYLEGSHPIVNEEHDYYQQEARNRHIWNINDVTVIGSWLTCWMSIKKMKTVFRIWIAYKTFSSLLSQMSEQGLSTNSWQRLMAPPMPALLKSIRTQTKETLNYALFPTQKKYMQGGNVAAITEETEAMKKLLETKFPRNHKI